MNKLDARLLNPTTQNYLRQQAIRLRKQGKRSGEIAHYLGVHHNTVSGWWQQYQQQGEATLEQQLRGNKLGEGRTLSPTQEALVQQQIREHFPDELEIDSALWTRQAVCSLIKQVSGVKMPIRTVGEYLKRWGMTPQKPLKRAYEQTPNWLRRGSSRSILASRSVLSKQEQKLRGEMKRECAQMLKSVGVMHPLAKLRKFA